MLKQMLLLLLATLAAALAADDVAVPVSSQRPMLQTDPIEPVEGVAVEDEAVPTSAQPPVLRTDPKEAVKEVIAEDEEVPITDQPTVLQTDQVAPPARALDLKPEAVEKVAAEERAVPISSQPPVRQTSPVVTEEAPQVRTLDLKPKAVQQVDRASAEELQQDEERPVSVPIFRSVQNAGDMDNWRESFRYELPDGTLREESMKLRSVGDARVPVVRGRSVWMGGDGKRIEMLYEADENGFRAYGDHLPREAGQEAVRPPESRWDPIFVVVNTPPPAPKPAPPPPKTRPWATLQRPLPSPAPRPTPSPFYRVPSSKLAGRRWV